MKRSTVFFTVLIAGIILSLSVIAMAQTTAQSKPVKVLHSFTGGLDGGFPEAGVIFDSAGNIYGTTFYGGSGCGQGCGVVYKLTPTGTGKWTESTIHRFSSEATGVYPTDLLFDAAGNLYGIDALGGLSGSCANNQNCAIAFELSATSAYRKETVLQVFSGAGTGIGPSGLVADAAGNLYGTASGTVFRLSPNGSGGWQETVLYEFPYGNTMSALVFDAAGNLYGTTSTGGSNNTYCQPFNGCGVVFELSPSASGTWTETVLYTFTGPDGAIPQSALTFDSTGNLYGTTLYGGNLTDCSGSFYPGGCGVIFKLSPSGGTWTETILHAFKDGADGAIPVTAVTLDAAGNVYGGTVAGGTLTDCNGGGCGVIFKLSPGSKGWTETVLHFFTGGLDGKATEGVPLTFGPDGNLYGTVAQGGTANYGVVFSIAP